MVKWLPGQEDQEQLMVKWLPGQEDQEQLMVKWRLAKRTRNS
jgi:hypothetical protein